MQSFVDSGPGAMPRGTACETHMLAHVANVLPPIAQYIPGEWTTLTCCRGQRAEGIFNVPTAFSRLLRHDDRISSYVDARVSLSFLMSYLQREMAFDSLLPLFKAGRGFELAECLRRGCTDKPRFQIYVGQDPKYEDPLAWRAIQGHSKSCATIEGMGWQKIGTDRCTLLWHGTKRSCTDSILQN